MDYKLTVLMPVYNRQEYIAEAISSVLMQQTNFKFQILVIDDASTDSSMDIVELLRRSNPDIIRVLKNETNLKLLKTIIKGYENTKTEYFCILDPDDYWTDEHKLQKAVDFLDENPDYTIYATNTSVLNEDNSMSVFLNIKEKEVDSDFNDYLQDKAVLGCSLGGVFRNVIFKNGVPEKLYNVLGSKYESAFRGDSYRNILHIREGKVHFVNEVDNVYRLHSNGIWSSMSKFSQDLLTAKFFVAMYKYFDKIAPEFFLEKRLAFYNANFSTVIDLMKSESNNEVSKNEIIEMLELILEAQKEHAEVIQNRHKQSLNVDNNQQQLNSTIISQNLKKFIDSNIFNKFYYKIYRHMRKQLILKGIIE